MNIDKEFQQKVAYRIKECRTRQDVSQQELAKALGYKDQSMISKIESGAVDLPSTKLSQIAAFFHMPIEYFLGLQEQTWHKSVIEDYRKERKFEAKQRIVEACGGVDPSVAYDFYMELSNNEVVDTPSGITTKLSEHEHELILAYRKQPQSIKDFIAQSLGVPSETAKSKNA